MKVTIEHITPGLEGIKSSAENPEAETWPDVEQLFKQCGVGIGFSPRNVFPELEETHGAEKAAMQSEIDRQALEIHFAKAAIAELAVERDEARAELKAKKKGRK